MFGLVWGGVSKNSTHNVWEGGINLKHYGMSKKLIFSNKGFQTNCWGPPLWFVLHMITLNYNPDQKKGYIQFFKSLQFVLPCKACRINYKETIKSHSKLKLTNSVFANRETLSFWLFKLHNFVTKCTRGEISEYTNSKTDFNKMISFYSQFRATCTLPQKNNHGGCNNPIKGGIKLKTKLRFVRFNPK